ncbi:MAG TPA: O-antigen ligase family protein, partial [Kofleriaceae bacterium]
MVSAHAFRLRDRRMPAVALAAMAIATVVFSRVVLRSDHQLAALSAGWPLLVVAGTLAAIAVHWIRAVVRGRFHALSSVELALASCVMWACIATLAMPRAPLWTYAVLPYLALGGVFVAARRLVDHTAVPWVLALIGALVAASVLLDAAGLAVVVSRRPGGLLGNRNFAGEYLALALPAALAVFTRSRRWWWILVAFGGTLALTRCRTAWLAASVAVVALVALSPPPLRSRRVLGAALVLAGVLLASVVPTRLAWNEAHPFTSTLSRAVDLEDGSGQLRVRQYVATLGVLDSRGAWLTGLGPGAWQAAVRAQDRAIAKNRVPHSDYLRVLSDAGAPALGGLCILLVVAALAAWQLRREHPELVVFLGVLALEALADAPLFRPEVIVATGAVLATLHARLLMARGSSCWLEPAPAGHGR